MSTLLPCYVGSYNLQLYQGATFQRQFVWNTSVCCGQNTYGATYSPVDITGYTATMQFRPFAGSATLLYDASSNIVLGDSAGTIILTLPASSTEDFTWFSAVYDLLMTDPYGNVTPLLAGNVTVTTAVSS